MKPIPMSDEVETGHEVQQLQGQNSGKEGTND